MAEVTMLVRVTVRLPGSSDYADATDRAEAYITDTLKLKNAVKSVVVVRMEGVTTR